MALRDDRLPEETDFTRLTWVKSSHSDNKEDECVEVSSVLDVIYVRDSKAPDAILTFPHASWMAFIESSLRH
ncbi:DUF397 domain-containing protein [Amycolatopsis speibonae]|uniref:DUF397 domain-containing protein n=1 Tax=Amycolatopsis speibonae TaxID=1450224 RepID=A0ABV7NRQ0_9PSEU